MAMLTLLLLAASAQKPDVPDCSLNGVKNAAGVCVCDKPWSGPGMMRQYAYYYYSFLHNH